VGCQGPQEGEEAHEDLTRMFTEMDDEVLETIYNIICHKLIIDCNTISLG
jgi:hypothetical protein